jgi:hypothetical protein
LTTQPDPALVQSTIAMLAGESDERFAESLADNIMDPMPEETAAFRSPELVARSVAAAKYLIDHVNTVIRTKTGDETSDKDVRRRREAFRNRVGYERRLLEEILRSEELQRGIIRNAPNPRARALRRLKQRHLAEYQDLVREETEKIAQERRDARRAAKDAARQRKAAERGLSHA